MRTNTLLVNPFRIKNKSDWIHMEAVACCGHIFSRLIANSSKLVVSSVFEIYQKSRKPLYLFTFCNAQSFFGEAGGIRTHVPLRTNGFQAYYIHQLFPDYNVLCSLTTHLNPLSIRDSELKLISVRYLRYACSGLTHTHRRDIHPGNMRSCLQALLP